jgi:hypothetical protein
MREAKSPRATAPTKRSRTTRTGAAKPRTRHPITQRNGGRCVSARGTSPRKLIALIPPQVSIERVPRTVAHAAARLRQVWIQATAKQGRTPSHSLARITRRPANPTAHLCASACAHQPLATHRQTRTRFYVTRLDFSDRATRAYQESAEHFSTMGFRSRRLGRRVSQAEYWIK